MGNAKIPALDQNQAPAAAADYWTLTDNLSLALAQLGDGFFPLEHTSVVNNVTRTNKSLNGEVLPGSGLHVLVRDFIAMIDGTVIAGKNKRKFSPSITTILNIPAGANSKIVLSVPQVVGSDKELHNDAVRGTLTVVPGVTMLTDDDLLVATVSVPIGTLQITSAMIIDGRKYLKNIDDISVTNEDMSGAIFDLNNTINIAKTNFKVDTLMLTSANNMFAGFVDAFVDINDVDAALSTPNSFVSNSQLTKLVVAGAAPSGLVAYYDFEEPSGLAILDRTGNGNDGILQGNAVRASAGGIAGQYVDFRGDIDATSDAGVIIPNPTCFNGITAVTIACWIYQRTLSPGGYLASSDQYLYQWVTGDNANSAGSLAAQPCSNGFSMLNTAANWAANTWTHVAFTFDAGLASPYGKLYVNGLPISVSPNGSPLALNTLPPVLQYFIGWNGGGAQMCGYIDEYAIFNRVLTDGEILALKNNIKVTFAPPTIPATAISKAHVAASSPTNAMLIADDSGDIAYSVSRDNGATWTSITKNVLFTFTTEPAGTQVRYKAVFPALTSNVDNIAIFWK